TATPGHPTRPAGQRGTTRGWPRCILPTIGNTGFCRTISMPCRQLRIASSTFTRLGQSLGRTDIYRIAQAFLENFVASYATPPEVIVLDLDHTDHLVYGKQELALFNGHYGDDCYLPLLIFEGLSGRLITA